MLAWSREHPDDESRHDVCEHTSLLTEAQAKYDSSVGLSMEYGNNAQVEEVTGLFLASADDLSAMSVQQQVQQQQTQTFLSPIGTKRAQRALPTAVCFILLVCFGYFGHISYEPSLDMLNRVVVRFCSSRNGCASSKKRHSGGGRSKTKTTNHFHFSKEKLTNTIWRKDKDALSIAFLGNSMMYFNDMPRFFQEVALRSGTRIYQDSCLHGYSSIKTLVRDGNGMYPQFRTTDARLERLTLPSKTDLCYKDEKATSRRLRKCYRKHYTLFDMGACSVAQLMTGKDDVLMKDPQHYGHSPKHHAFQNPCRRDPLYLLWTDSKYSNQNVTWDFVLINDNTHDPAIASKRKKAKKTLRRDYAGWLKTNGAIPVFLDTYAFSSTAGSEETSATNLALESNVSDFTSLVYQGYQDYANYLGRRLPTSQAPRVAPCGLAFLMVYEEQRETWKRLFSQSDQKHPSPTGTYLQTLVVYSTIMGRMPPPPLQLLKNSKSTNAIKKLWKHARMMQHSWDPPNPWPTFDDMEYLYGIAQRIHNGEKPRTLTEKPHRRVRHHRNHQHIHIHL